jgi:hypothetical protein
VKYSIVAATLAALAAQLALAAAFIPPWQNPDEPQHVITVRLLMRHGPYFDIHQDRDDVGERAIVRSMAEYGWWTHYGVDVPDPVPSTFAAGPAQVVKDYFGPLGESSRLYHRGVASFFAVAGIEDVTLQMYAMRAVSMLAGLLTVLCIRAGSQIWLGDVSALVISTLAALHPQFVIVASTAGPDAIVNLASGVFWLFAVLTLSRSRIEADMGYLRRKWWPLLAFGCAMWASAILAFQMRRIGMPLIVTAAFVTLIVVVRPALAARRRSVLTGALFATCAAALLATATGMIDSDGLTRAGRWIQIDPAQSVATFLERLNELPRFVSGVFQSFWLAVGWLRHFGPASWYDAIAVVSIVSGIGVLIPRSSSGHRTMTALAGVMVAVQVGAVVALYFGILRQGAQGRYLFPVLPAILSLLWIGWSGWFGPQYHRVAAILLVCLMAVFNAAAWVAVIVPAYA